MLTRLSTVQEGAAPAPMPGFLEAVVDVSGTRVRIFDTHTDYRPDPAVRAQQVAEMLAIIGDGREPTLLFGDLNALPGAPELQPLLRRLRDSWTNAEDPGLTFPATEASDHRPVVAELVLDPMRN